MNKPYHHDDRPVGIQLGHTLELGPAVLAADLWAYVDHCLIKKDASASTSVGGPASASPTGGLATPSSATESRSVRRFFWRQAQHFALGLSAQLYESQPLHLYYSMLNATKAMILSFPTIPASFDYHGLSFRLDPNSETALDGTIKVSQKGAFCSLCMLMGDTTAVGSTLKLRELLGQIAGIHRAYCMTCGISETLIPLAKTMRLFHNSSGKFWFESELADSVNVSNVTILSPLALVKSKRLVKTQATKLNHKSTTFPADLAEYHKQCRRQISVIYGRDRTSHYIWSTPRVRDWSQISLNFALGFALSSLARYHPEKLNHLYEDEMGWVVKEYLRTALTQYIAFVSAEITGRLIQQPYASL